MFVLRKRERQLLRTVGAQSWLAGRNTHSRTVKKESSDKKQFDRVKRKSSSLDAILKYHCTLRAVGCAGMLTFQGFSDEYPPEAADQGPGEAGAAIVIDNGAECRAGWAGQARYTAHRARLHCPSHESRCTRPRNVCPEQQKTLLIQVFYSHTCHSVARPQNRAIRTIRTKAIDIPKLGHSAPSRQRAASCRPTVPADMVWLDSVDRRTLCCSHCHAASAL